MRHHGVLVLSDLSLPPGVPPLAAVAFRVDRAARTAQLAGIGVRAQLRGRGLGRGLLTGALTWLRADGLEQVHAVAARDGAAAPVLAADEPDQLGGIERVAAGPVHERGDHPSRRRSAVSRSTSPTGKDPTCLPPQRFTRWVTLPDHHLDGKVVLPGRQSLR
jgi:GNAT superfamily N-acetyltransferase